MIHLLKSNHQYDVLRGGAFGKWLGHGQRDIMNGIPICIKDAPESCCFPSTMWEHSEKPPCMKQEVGPCQIPNLPFTLILYLSASRTMRMNFCCL
jgi:hypothetical protein